MKGPTYNQQGSLLGLAKDSGSNPSITVSASLRCYVSPFKDASESRDVIRAASSPIPMRNIDPTIESLQPRAVPGATSTTVYSCVEGKHKNNPRVDFT